VILLLDENLSGRRILEGLLAHGIPVQAQTELMPRGIPDDEVLQNLAGHPGCCLLTKDSDFHRHPAVRQALLLHGIGAFVITAHKDKTATELVRLIAKAWPRMQRFTDRHRRPFMAKILADGRVEDAT
jgi:predicted nuclease of predicted toxin-antitoxin system